MNDQISQQQNVEVDLSAPGTANFLPAQKTLNLLTMLEERLRAEGYRQFGHGIDIPFGSGVIHRFGEVET